MDSPVETDQNDFNRKSKYWFFVRKSIKWTIGHAAFGLLPLIFMFCINLMSGRKAGNEAINRLFHDGIHLFVCCAVMGVIIVEIYLSHWVVKASHLIQLLSIPALIIVYILLDYILIELGTKEDSSFNPTSTQSIFVIILTFIFCIFTKANIYIRE